MAAEVSSSVRFMNGGDTHEPENSTAQMITMDLLDGCYHNKTSSSSSLEAKELDLDLQVPCGWEKRLDLKSGNVYLKRCNNNTLNLSPSSSSDHAQNYKPQNTKLSDFTMLSPKQTKSLFDEKTLDLKLVSSSVIYNQSVCTLDKVKTALERAEKVSCARKRSISSLNNSHSPLNSNSSSSIRDADIITCEYDRSPSSSFASGCPCCLMYVLISTSDPKCPRCNSIVPFPEVAKKPRIDLNIAI